MTPNLSVFVGRCDKGALSCAHCSYNIVDDCSFTGFAVGPSVGARA